MSKDTRIAFRVTDEKKERLAAVAKLVGLTETALAEACVDALIEYIETHGEIRMPLAVVPKKTTGNFPSTARALPGAPSLNEETSRPGAVTPTPLEKYTRIRPAARKARPKS